MTDRSEAAGQRKYTHANEATQAGFTPLPNVVLRDESLSAQARLLYGLMKDYAWRGVEPELEEVGADLSVGRKAARSYADELERAGLLSIRRRGQGLTNLYVVLDPGEAQTGREGEVKKGEKGTSRSREMDLPRAGASASGEDKDESEDTPLSPPAPKTVARKPVTIGEHAFAAQVLDSFNGAFGTRFASPDWLTKIILRLREHPELDLDAHRAIIEANRREPWWSGPASPSVVYGNGALFERAMLAGRGPAPERRYSATELAGMTDEQVRAADPFREPEPDAIEGEAQEIT